MSPGRVVRRVVRRAPVAWLVLSTVATIVFVVLSVSGPHLDGEFVVAPGDVAIAPIGLAFAAVGAVVALRLPRHPVGWLLGVFGTSFACGRAAEVHVAQGLLAGASRPGAVVLNWLLAYAWAFGQLALAMALLHFPTGRLPSPRWRPLRWLAIALVPALVALTGLLWPVRADPSLLIDTSAFPPLADALAGFLEVPVLLTTVLAAVSLVPRYRAADPVGRLQLRWLFVAVVPVVVGFGALLATGGNPNGVAPPAALVLLGLGFTAIPVSIAVAVLRYRLWDLGRVVSRGVEYVAVSLVLVGLYLVAVIALQSVLRPVVGEGDLPVALATLVAAAAARPVLRTVQSAVDRRFNRAHYDATRTVDAFARSLRDEVSRDAVVDGLRRVAAETLGPEAVGVVLVGRAPTLRPAGRAAP